MKKEIKYQITKKECQRQIDKWSNVCDRCGRELVPIKTVDNAGSPTYWSGCMHGTDSGNFTSGVPKEIYEVARKLVLDGESYSHTGKAEHRRNRDLKEYWLEKETSGLAELLMRAEYLKKNKPRYTKTEFIKNF